MKEYLTDQFPIDIDTPLTVLLQRLVELGVILFIPFLLFALHAFLPEETQHSFYFQFGDPVAITVWTSTLLHISWSHLIGNIIGYLLLSIIGYEWYLRVEQKRVVTIMFSAVLLLTPPVLKFVDYLVLYQFLGVADTETTSAGFSGIVGAMLGSLIIVIGLYFIERSGSYEGFWVVFGVLLTPVSVLLLLYTPPHPQLLVAVLAISAGIVLVIYETHSYLDVNTWEDVNKQLKNHDQTIMLLTGSTVALAFLLVQMLSPSSDGGPTVNILAHVTGIVFGFILSVTILCINEYN